MLPVTLGADILLSGKSWQRVARGEGVELARAYCLAGCARAWLGGCPC